MYKTSFSGRKPLLIFGDSNITCILEHNNPYIQLNSYPVANASVSEGLQKIPPQPSAKIVFALGLSAKTQDKQQLNGYTTFTEDLKSLIIFTFTPTINRPNSPCNTTDQQQIPLNISRTQNRAPTNTRDIIVIKSSSWTITKSCTEANRQLNNKSSFLQLKVGWGCPPETQKW